MSLIKGVQGRRLMATALAVACIAVGSAVMVGQGSRLKRPLKRNRSCRSDCIEVSGAKFDSPPPPPDLSR
ncbi:MAG: hypothetical protein WBV94_32605 [Blastocatellia bacterium]